VSHMARFTRSYKVRFEDCDSAGIVFFPNYFLMLNRLIEDWFDEALQVSLGTLHHQLKMGVPLVEIHIVFKKPSLLEEILDWSLEVRKLGSRSLTLGIMVSCGGEERIEIETTLVSVNLIPDGVASREIPADIRAGMEKHLATG
jgi:4-hydroxybenzoyl-CoA thioesterase